MVCRHRVHFPGEAQFPPQKEKGCLVPGNHQSIFKKQSKGGNVRAFFMHVSTANPYSHDLVYGEDL